MKIWSSYRRCWDQQNPQLLRKRTWLHLVEFSGLWNTLGPWLQRLLKGPIAFQLQKATVV